MGEPLATDLLSPAEVARLDRLRLEADRNRFAAAAITLRLAVGQVTDTDPAVIVIDRTCLECGADHGPPLFTGLHVWGSVSHSGSLVVVAVSTTGPVGVDIEHLGRAAKPVSRDFLDQVVSPSEPAPYCWLETWVRKEALLKLCGAGLRFPMAKLRLAEDGHAAFRLIDPPAMLHDATVRDLAFEGAIGAVATFGPAELKLARE